MSVRTSRATGNAEPVIEPGNAEPTIGPINAELIMEPAAESGYAEHMTLI